MKEIDQDPRQDEVTGGRTSEVEEVDERSENVRIQDELDTGIDEELERDILEDEEDVPGDEDRQQLLPAEDSDTPLFDPTEIDEDVEWREEGEMEHHPEQYDSAEEFIEEVFTEVIGYYPDVGVQLHGDYAADRAGDEVIINYELDGEIPLMNGMSDVPEIAGVQSEQLTSMLAGDAVIGLRVDMEETDEGYRVTAEFRYDGDDLQEGAYRTAERLEKLEKELGFDKFP